MQCLTLALLDAPDLTTTLEALGDSLLNDFHADAYVTGLFVDRSRLAGLALRDISAVRTLSAEDEDIAAFSGVISGGKPLCGHLRQGQIGYLFGETATENIASAAVVALHARRTAALEIRCVGLLGIGSRDAKRYHAGMGTLFLSHLGEVAGRAVGRYLPVS